MNTKPTAYELIERSAERLGYSVTTRTAQTGTVYMDLETDTVLVRVRVSDHMEVYPPEKGLRQLSVSPDELSVREAIEALANPWSIEPSSGPAERTPEQRQWDNERGRAHKQARRAARENAERLRQRITPEMYARFRKFGSDLHAARQVAEEFGIVEGMEHRGRMLRALRGFRGGDGRPSQRYVTACEDF